MGSIIYQLSVDSSVQLIRVTLIVTVFIYYKIQLSSELIYYWISDWKLVKYIPIQVGYLLVILKV
jgi:hypothetical protein